MVRSMVVCILWVLLVNAAIAADKPAAGRALLERVIPAQGDETLVRKYVAMHFKLQGTYVDNGQKLPACCDSFYQGFDHMRTQSIDVDTGAPVLSVEVLCGKQGWTKSGTEPAVAFSAAQLRQRQESAYTTWTLTLLPLRAPEFQLCVLDEIPVAGRPAVGLRVEHKKHDPVKLYFDKETRLLVQCQTQVRNADLDRSYEETSVYSDYRDLQGIKVAYAMTIYHDGVKVADLSVAAGDLHEKPFDATVFARP